MQALFNVAYHGESVVIVWLNFVKGGTIIYLAWQYEWLCNNKVQSIPRPFKIYTAKNHCSRSCLFTVKFRSRLFHDTREVFLE